MGYLNETSTRKGLALGVWEQELEKAELQCFIEQNTSRFLALLRGRVRKMKSGKREERSQWDKEGLLLGHTRCSLRHFEIVCNPCDSEPSFSYLPSQDAIYSKVDSSGMLCACWWLSSVNPSAKAGVSSSIPGLGRCPGEGNDNPLQYSCLENPLDRGAWWATVWGHKESNMTEHTQAHTPYT